MPEDEEAPEIRVDPRPAQQRSGTDGSREFDYLVRGALDSVQAKQAIPGEPFYDENPDLWVRKASAQELEIPDGRWWYVTARYERVDHGGGGEGTTLQYGFSVTTQTVNVKRSRGRTSIRRPGTNYVPPPGYEGQINVERTGLNTYTTRGVDVLVPQGTLDIEREYPRGQWNARVMTALRKVGRVNSDPFEGFAAEEVLFVGGRMTRTATNVAATYQFMVQPGEVFTVDGVGSLPKPGWRYGSVYFDNGVALEMFVDEIYGQTTLSDLLR